jgi:hypothetical protein
VSEKVRLQVAPLIETSVADRTLVRRFLHVQDLVYRQSATLAEAFAAFGALERFLLAVDVPATKGNLVSVLTDDSSIVSIARFILRSVCRAMMSRYITSFTFRLYVVVVVVASERGWMAR